MLSWGGFGRKEERKDCRRVQEVMIPVLRVGLWDTKSAAMLAALVIRIIPRGAWTRGPKFIANRPISVEIFSPKPQMWTSRWRWIKSQRITTVIRMYLLGNMILCTNFHSNPSHSSRDTLVLWKWLKTQWSLSFVYRFNLSYHLRGIHKTTIHQ